MASFYVAWWTQNGLGGPLLIEVLPALVECDASDRRGEPWIVAAHLSLAERPNGPWQWRNDMRVACFVRGGWKRNDRRLRGVPEWHTLGAFDISYEPDAF